MTLQTLRPPFCPSVSLLVISILILAYLTRTASAADAPPASQPAKVTFDAENTMFVDGKPFVPIFMWHGGTPETALMGENITRRILTSDAQYWQRMSPIPYSFIRVTTLEKDWRAQLKEHVPFVKNQPSTLVYFLTHEPGFAAEPPELVNEMARMLNDLDPDHPSFVHIGGDNPIRARSYSQDSKILSISGMGISPGLAAFKVSRAQLNTDMSKSIWPCLHAFMPDVTGYTTDDSARVDPRTLRAGLYASIIAGAKGISLYAPDHYVEWYNDFRPKNPKKMDDLIIETYNSIGGLMAEVRYLTPVIGAPTCAQTYTVNGDDGRLVTLMKAVGGELFLLTVNFTTDSFDAAFDVSSLTQGAEFEVRAPLEYPTELFGRTVKARSADPAFTDHFGPFEVHVYQITSRADQNAMKPGDAAFHPPLETQSERRARLQATMARVMPHVIFSPIDDRDPMYWDEAGGVKRLRLDAADYARPLALAPFASPGAKRPAAKREPNQYSDVTRFYLLPRPGDAVTIQVTDVKGDATTPPGALLIAPDGKETKRYAPAGKDSIKLNFTAPAAGGVYTLIVKSRGHHVAIDGCPSVIDASTELTYTGDPTTLYFHVPAGMKTFSITSMVAKGPKKGVDEANMIEVIDPAGKVVGKSTAHYLERMLPLEQGGGEREDWQPAVNDPGPAKVVVHRSDAAAQKDAVYSVRLTKPDDPKLSYVSTFFLRLDSPLSGLVAEDPADLAVVVQEK